MAVILGELRPGKVVCEYRKVSIAPGVVQARIQGAVANLGIVVNTRVKAILRQTWQRILTNVADNAKVRAARCKGVVEQNTEVPAEPIEEAEWFLQAEFRAANAGRYRVYRRGNTQIEQRSSIGVTATVCAA